MTPPASVSGLYFAHPQARYFAVGRIGRDQVEDYAKRRGDAPEETERWLRPNLGYEPDRRSHVASRTSLSTSAPIRSPTDIEDARVPRFGKFVGASDADPRAAATLAR